MKQTKLWTMRDGTKIRICDMSNLHLQNTMKMLERIAEINYQDELATAYVFAGQCRGEMASYCAEQDAENVTYKLPDIYWNMRDDSVRRGLIKET